MYLTNRFAKIGAWLSGLLMIVAFLVWGSAMPGSSSAAPGSAAVQTTPTARGVTIPGTGSRTFPETGKTVRGLFLSYWEKNGGLAQQGFPISELMSEVSDLDGKSYTVQYFERAVFEYHPEKAAPYDMLLSQLGTFQYRSKYPNGAPSQQPNTTAGSILFPETGKRLGGRFLQYWQQNGALPQQGFPISEEFVERSDLDGKEYRVQYFERAVFEVHPENKPPFDVLLSQLGTFQYRAKYLNSPGSPTATPTTSPAADVEGMADVGGHKLYYSCKGQGSPTVLMDAGLGESSGTWSRVQPEIARFARVCVYDRANTGKSDRGPTPRTAMNIARELSKLLEVAKIPGPYIVVGHSQGGLNMLMFAELYKSEIAGIVSVDGAPPDIGTRYQAVLTPAQFEQYKTLLSQNREGLTYNDLQVSGEQVLAGGPLPDVPFIILRHGKDTEQPQGWPVAALEQVWREAQEALSKRAPQGKVVVAQNSGHFIHVEQPQLVVDTIREVAEKAR